jgi:hypothetical protein
MDGHRAKIVAQLAQSAADRFRHLTAASGIKAMPSPMSLPLAPHVSQVDRLHPLACRQGRPHAGAGMSRRAIKAGGPQAEAS